MKLRLMLMKVSSLLLAVAAAVLAAVAVLAAAVALVAAVIAVAVLAAVTVAAAVAIAALVAVLAARLAVTAAVLVAAVAAAVAAVALLVAVLVAMLVVTAAVLVATAVAAVLVATAVAAIMAVLVAMAMAHPMALDPTIRGAFSTIPAIFLPSPILMYQTPTHRILAPKTGPIRVVRPAASVLAQGQVARRPLPAPLLDPVRQLPEQMVRSTTILAGLSLSKTPLPELRVHLAQGSVQAQAVQARAAQVWVQARAAQV
ncbi:hypothetical protein NDI45_01825 [Leptolyngbya sp. GB1-A1]|uniref:hypothetical protein n=1 Tax=Leptolyngbya sp. GB1-A1 TaxID=2933908 RepID=UPI0032968CC5